MKTILLKGFILFFLFSADIIPTHFYNFVMSIPSVLNTHTLHSKFSLPEISGASGLYYSENQLFIISDDSHVLYRYEMENEGLHKISLLESGELQEKLPKNLKPDFEAVAHYAGSLYLFGSGSSERRFTGVKYDLKSEAVETFSLREIYTEMLEKVEIDFEDLNIEGAIIKEKTIYFFNRGNGPGKKNGIFVVENWEEEPIRKFQFREVKLPSISGRDFTFSDAILWKDRFLFLATAEDTDNTYDDGVVLGSAVGIINTENYRVEEFEILTREYKLEGITRYKESARHTSFLLCDDADGETDKTRVFELK